jgi:flagellar biosynthesis/type III secretory pathway M-ring protein FliF/YscJ
MIDSEAQSKRGHFSQIIIPLFSTFALVPILVVITRVIFKRRKETRKKQSAKSQKHENQFRFDDGLQQYDEIMNENEENSYEIIKQNEENSYELMNYKLDNYDIGDCGEINND